MSKKLHYILMESSAGCLPDAYEVYERKCDALDMGRQWISESKDTNRHCQYSIRELRSGVTWDGVRCIEIVSCDCGNIENHLI